MSGFLDRLKFFKRTAQPFADGHGVTTQEDRSWEEGYRNRWRHDKVVRSTHGVNCTGGCSWKIHVKGGLVAFEMQQTDYPATRPDMPNHEPRGCQRGASFSWYLYSPHRIKYPLIRGRLLALYRQMRMAGKDPVDAWAAIQADPALRIQYTAVRGLGGFVRAEWDEVVEMIAAANIYTIEKYGPDRIYGFSPIPAMSMISYAAGSRYLSLIGGVPLSFYDWYCDLPPSSPQTWGEQTDVPESADWYNSGYIIICGANLPMTRTPDAHFAVEARYNGTKIVSMAPDYAEYVKLADHWLPVRQGTDAAAFLAMGHVVLKEFFLDRIEAYFWQYAQQYTDLPLLVTLRQQGTHWVPDRFLRASDFADSLGEENNPAWKTVLFDEISGTFVCPNGSIGFRWGEEGRWNILPRNARDQHKISAQLSAIDHRDGLEQVALPHFTPQEGQERQVVMPVRRIDNGKTVLVVATVFDLQVAHYGLSRGLPGETSVSFDDPNQPYTPAWQEKITGVAAADIIRTAREFADNAAKTQGKSMIILGAAANHWYHSDMSYRSTMNLLHLCGCVGQSGGGWAHYVGQEKLRPQAGWAPIAFGLDWHKPARLMNGTSFFYFHTDQWRYERLSADSFLTPSAKGKYRGYQLVDYNVVAQRLGWLPSAPHFNRNPLEMCRAAEAAGARSDAEIVQQVVADLKNHKTTFAAEDIDAPENFPRNLFVWRANLLGSSAKGHEYFLKHLLGAQNGVLSQGTEGQAAQEIKWHPQAPTGKLDLLVDINFRLNSTGAYADIVLPTATWYEKTDLNTTDMHPFVHPLNEAVAPAWQSRTDWQIFQSIAKRFSELAKDRLGVCKDLLAVPSMHDSPGELGQPFGVFDWKKGDVEPLPGKTLPNLAVVERDFGAVYDKFITLGPLLVSEGNSVKGLHWESAESYEELKILNGCHQDRPLLMRDEAVCEAILNLAPETHGEVAYKAWRALEKKTGLSHTHLSAARREERIRFQDICVQPRKIITAPTWSGIESEKVSYTASYTNIHEFIPFRTLTGRAQFYQDHEWMLDFGEGLCTYRPAVLLQAHEHLPQRVRKAPHLLLNWITPHSKWGIHSTYNDNLRMLSLFRGGPTVWVAEADAKSIGLLDNDWVEAVNANGATVARVVVSQRIPVGMAMMYHAQEKTINVPASPSTGKRGGILNSVTRIVVKPTHMIGGYAQLSYGFNYYGTVGSQRDEFVALHKIEAPHMDWLEGALTPEREAHPNPPAHLLEVANGQNSTPRGEP